MTDRDAALESISMLRTLLRLGAPLVCLLLAEDKGVAFFLLLSLSEQAVFPWRASPHPRHAGEHAA